MIRPNPEGDFDKGICSCPEQKQPSCTESQLNLPLYIKQQSFYPDSYRTSGLGFNSSVLNKLKISNKYYLENNKDNKKIMLPNSPHGRGGIV